MSHSLIETLSSSTQLHLYHPAISMLAIIRVQTVPLALISAANRASLVP